MAFEQADMTGRRGLMRGSGRRGGCVRAPVRTPGPRRRNAKAFTLVELLVAVGVIALLIAILTPTLDRAGSVSRSAVCRGHLRQLWEVFHASGPDSPLAWPSPGAWVGFVGDRVGTGLMRCPEDPTAPSAGGGLEGLYVDHFHCDGLHYHVYLTDALRPGAPLGTGVLQQVSVVHVSDTVKELRIYGGAAIRITLGVPIIIDGLYDNLNTIGGSNHHLYHFDEMVMHLGGMDNHQGPRPERYVVGSSHVSYGMNKQVRDKASRASQVLLLDYEKSVADAAEDAVGGELEYLAPRHMGQVNAVFVDGSVRGMWPEDLDAEAALWQP